jgi:hypothetical protein
MATQDRAASILWRFLTPCGHATTKMETPQ